MPCGLCGLPSDAERRTLSLPGTGPQGEYPTAEPGTGPPIVDGRRTCGGPDPGPLGAHIPEGEAPPGEQGMAACGEAPPGVLRPLWALCNVGGMLFLGTIAGPFCWPTGAAPAFGEGLGLSTNGLVESPDQPP
mmetsp:Transcript_52020/g.96315  ORF Transcript_52020/g.96315 Transcript_52020/m.96315 type:complete len:133 (+) Transcript_52020:163-561(+)